MNEEFRLHFNTFLIYLSIFSSFHSINTKINLSLWKSLFFILHLYCSLFFQDLIHVLFPEILHIQLASSQHICQFQPNACSKTQTSHHKEKQCLVMESSQLRIMLCLPDGTCNQREQSQRCVLDYFHDTQSCAQ